MLIPTYAVVFNSLLDVGNILYNRIFMEDDNPFLTFVAKRFLSQISNFLEVNR